MTRSPSANPWPDSATTPSSSWPRIRSVSPGGGEPNSPAEISRSVPQTPTSSVRISRPSGRGSGSGTVAVRVVPAWSGVVISACIGSHVMFAGMALVVTWLGQASFRFDVGDRRILVDPFFAEHEARLYPPLSVDEHGSEVDWLLVTHPHIDHLDPIRCARSPPAAPISRSSRRRRASREVRDAARTRGSPGSIRGDRARAAGGGRRQRRARHPRDDGGRRLSGRPALRRLRARARRARASTTRATRS